MNQPIAQQMLLNRARLIDRFLRYVAVDTSANGDSSAYPSSTNQRVLAEIVAQDLRSCGVADVQVDENSLVWGFLQASDVQWEDSPVVLFNAHLDTSPEAPSATVRPRIIEQYDGNPIALGNGISIDETNTAELPSLIGKTLIVTDGTTLLGGDDKAGVAAVVEFVATLIEQKIPHGPLQVLFTCDEEIGRGTDRVDMSRCVAKVAYTLDGGGEGVIEGENFSADAATIHFRGHNIHPAIAKGKMINALRAAATFVSLMPQHELSPETTCERDGFLHPYRLDGHVGQATVKVLLRDFDTNTLTQYRQLLEDIAVQVRERHAGIEIEIESARQYRNMADGLAKVPAAVDLALEAYRQLGLIPREDRIRGGTDGAVLTEKGLPTPNLAVGQHNIHSVREFVCIDELETAIRHLIALSQLWMQQK